MPRSQYFNQRGQEITADEALDHGILRDGYSMRTPMRFRDSAASHRPGFRIADATNDERETAWLEMVRDAEQAWRHPVADRKRTTTTKRDPHGHLLSTSETEEYEEDGGDVRDHRTHSLGELRQFHADAVAEPLEEYRREQAEAWRANK